MAAIIKITTITTAATAVLMAIWSLPEILMREIVEISLFKNSAKSTVQAVEKRL